MQDSPIWQTDRLIVLVGKPPSQAHIYFTFCCPSSRNQTVRLQDNCQVWRCLRRSQMFKIIPFRLWVFTNVHCSCVNPDYAFLLEKTSGIVASQPRVPSPNNWNWFRHDGFSHNVSRPAFCCACCKVRHRQGAGRLSSKQSLPHTYIHFEVVQSWEGTVPCQKWRFWTGCGHIAGGGL